MKPVYPYYEVKYAVDTFVETYGDRMTKDKWSIISKPCKKCDGMFDVSIRKTDERYFYKTTSGKVRKNEDYLRPCSQSIYKKHEFLIAHHQ